MDYKPINCNLYDQIESYAVKKNNVDIIYLDEELKKEKISGKVENIYSNQNSEFLTISNINIRLDKIKSISEK